MRSVRSVKVFVPAVLLAAAAFSGTAAAGAKIVSLQAAGSIPTLSGTTELGGFTRNPLAGRITGIYPERTRDFPPYYRAPRPWNERAFLRGPDFPTPERALRSHIRPGPTRLNTDNRFRQRIQGSRSAGQGSLWAGTLRGGRTVEQGSPWRSRIRY